MFIAIVDFSVDSENRDRVVTRLLQDKEAIRAMEGNLAFDPYTDPADDKAVRVWHEWHDLQHFRAYMASETFKTLAVALHPLTKSPPFSRRMTAELLETVG